MLASCGWELVRRDDVGFGRGESKDGTVERGGEIGSSVSFEEEKVVVEVCGGRGEARNGVQIRFDGETKKTERKARETRQLELRARRVSEEREEVTHEL